MINDRMSVFSAPAPTMMKLTSVIACLLLLLCACASHPSVTMPLDLALNERVLMIPAHSGNSMVMMETTIFTPPGKGPFPLLIMNHGKAPGNPHSQPRARYLVISREFVKRGYAVIIPMRKGFAESTGDYTVNGCDTKKTGLDQADNIQDALDYALQQAWADKDRILIAGQSHGGLSSIAFGTHHVAGVKGILNFAGGSRVNNCTWKDKLVDAFAYYGAHSTLPSLWFYGANDSYFNPELASNMLAAYKHAGGHASLIAYGPFKTDSHPMSSSPDGVAIWWPETEKFLTAIGLPTKIVEPALKRSSQTTRGGRSLYLYKIPDSGRLLLLDTSPHRLV